MFAAYFLNDFYAVTELIFATSFKKLSTRYVVVISQSDYWAG